MGRQHSHMRCGCSVKWEGHTTPFVPSWIGELADLRWPSLTVLQSFGVDDQYPSAGSEADPGPIGGAVIRRPCIGNWPSARGQQPLLLQSNRVENFIVPKDIAFRRGALLLQTRDKPERFRCLDIELPHHFGTCFIPLVGIQNRRSIFTICGAIQNNRGFGLRNTPRSEREKKELSD